MATYEELASLMRHGMLEAKIGVAAVIAAEAIRTEDGGTVNHANRLLWAKAAATNPKAAAAEILPLLLAQNKANTSIQIQDATDPAIQTAVDSVVDIFATG